MSRDQQEPSGHSARTTRRKGRELALQALYQIEITGDPSANAVDLFLHHFEGNAKAKEFARRLVSGVVSQCPAIDHKIAAIAEHKSQFRDGFAETRREVARSLGHTHGVQYAEVFEVLRISL